MWHLMSPVYLWPFIYTVSPALLISSPLLFVQLVYLRKRDVFFDGRFFGVVEIYKHSNPVVICISGTKRFVAECCSIKYVKPFFLPNILFGGLPSFIKLAHATQVALKHLFRPVVYAHTCLSLSIILSILSASEMLVEASELFSECSLMPFICFPHAHSNHCLFTVYLILDSHSNCSGHSFVYRFFMPVVITAAA
jgi:hypothetical protein